MSVRKPTVWDWLRARRELAYERAELNCARGLWWAVRRGVRWLFFAALLIGLVGYLSTSWPPSLFAAFLVLPTIVVVPAASVALYITDRLRVGVRYGAPSAAEA